MDICNILKCINNLNEYISVTQDIINKYSNSNILFNMSTVLSLKKIRSFEIEYFNKCDENGAAFIVLERILCLPPSKTWSLLGVELISLVQYWLEALRKHLIFHNNHWWNFLNTLLSFIEKIRLKSASIKNILVQETAECLLDLATNVRPDLTQRYKIIHCLNLCSADCSREIRTSMREKFGSYFTRLAALMSSCGDVATQYAVLEVLLRWLLPRHDAVERARAAADWFPPRLYSTRCVDIFLERRWRHFFQDARDFLNVHNSESGLVVSAACEHFTIGSVVLISETDDKQYWVDINTCSQSISLMLEPKLLEVLEGSSSSCDVLVVHQSNVEKIYLQREGTKLNISVTTLDPQLLFPSNVLDGGDLVIVLNSADFGKVDAALRTAFQDKYLVLTNVDSHENKESKSRYFNSMTKDQVVSGSRPDAKKKKHSGFILKPRVPGSLQSPSTASTSSLAMLRDKLTGFSGFIYDKEPVGVCAVPQLSTVSEVSEPEEKRSFNSLSTLKLRSCGVLRKSKITESEKIPSDSSQDASEKRKGISPVLDEEEEASNVSCLLVATIGSADDSFINDTLGRLPKDKDVHTDNIVELLAREALQYRQATTDTKTVSEIKTGVNNCLKQVFNYPNTNKDKQSYLLKNQTVISNTTTDDSNLDVVENTPVYGTKNTKKVVEEKFTDKRCQENLKVDNQIIEQFFSQHINENSNREILISPTLARKINQSSSESSELEDFMPDVVDNNFNINHIEIIECLNEMVDTVCKDLEKYSKYLSQDVIELDKLNDEGRSSKCVYFNDITNVNEVSEIRNEDKIEPTPTKGIKLKFNTKKSKVVNRRLKNKKIELEPVVEIAEILESKKVITSENVYANENPVTQSVEPETFKTPDIRRKRKLYSPKDDISNERDADINESESNQNIPVKSKPDLIKNNKSMITPYKEIENMRKKANTNIRNKTRKNELLLSPRSKNRNEMFDNLKNTIEGEKNITLVERNTRNKQAIYNFPSDSEDEDFKDKEVFTKSNKKKTNNTTTRKSTGRRKLNRPKNDDVKSQKVTNIKPNTRSRKKAAKKNNENSERPQLSFELMRGPPPECLELSFVAEGQSEICDNDPKPIVAVVPEMELVNNDEFKEKKSKQRKKRKINKEEDTVKSTGNINKLMLIEDKPDDKDVTVSPLPGLVIEAVPPREDSTSICMLEGFKDISGEKNFTLLNNTQNLLSDVDLVGCPPHYNVSDQISVATSNESKIRKNKHNLSTRKRRKTQKIKTEVVTKIHKSPRKETINLNSSSEKSIITAGKSPITAHGNFDEAPPSFQQLSQRIVEPRDLDVSNLSRNMKDYFKILNQEINSSSRKSYSSSNDQETKTSKTKPKETKTVSNLSPVVSIARLSLEDIGRWIPPRFNSVFGSNQSSNDSVERERTPSIKRTIAKHKEYSIDVELKVDKEINKTESIRKSLISPIKLFDDIVEQKEVSNSRYSYKINEVFDNNLLRNNSDLSSSRYYLRSNLRTHMATSSHTKESPSVDRNEKNLRFGSEKRQYMGEYESPKKKKKVFNKVQRNMELESAPSASSVHEWVTRNIAEKNMPNIYAANENYPIPENGSVTSENSKTQRKPSRGKQLAESVDLALKDSIETVLEKLDTTLLEIHHNTSKKLVNMFLGIQKSLSDVKERRQQMYKEGARELLSDMIKLIDAKFMDLDRRSQEMDDQFMSDMKEQTREVLRNDCKQKRVMVTLLREDIQAVTDHVARTDRSHTDAE